MPRRSSRSSATSGSKVNAEVAALFRMGNQVDQSTLIALRKKYGDSDLADKIQEVFMERHRIVVKGAKKFAEAIRNKYANSNVPYHQLLMKARLHAQKLGISAAEFAEFQRIYEQELSGSGRANEVVLPLTNMMKVLGNITSGGATEGFNVGSGDYRNLQEILRLYEASKPLHSQIVLQSLQYESFDKVAMEGSLDTSRHNPGEHVHPVVAAMFLPKINLFDSHFLYANISGIIKSLYNKEALRTRPDYELYYNLVTDPNDIVCDDRTPVADLLQRCNLQNQLWNAVLHLRNGQYFNSSFREFMTAVDVCRLNKHDNPDLVYGRHDGTILKRILSAFSFRPTVIATAPIANVFATNPYAQNIRPTVTQIPMINIRLLTFQQNILAQPLLATGVANPSYPTSVGDIGKADFLAQALSQTMTFIEGNMLVNRATKVIYSREAIIFYVDRRANLVPYGMKLFNLSRLPTAVAGFERITTTPMNVPESLTVENEQFILTSGILAETRVDEQNSSVHLVTGSTAFLNTRVAEAGKRFTVPQMTTRPDKQAEMTAAKEAAVATPADLATANKYQIGGAVGDYYVKYDPMNALRQDNNKVIYTPANLSNDINSKCVVLIYTAPAQSTEGPKAMLL
jgi:hypothetical protein